MISSSLRFHLEEMAEAGFLPAPAGYDKIDAEVCQEGECYNCGHTGLLYRPFLLRRELRPLYETRRLPDIYRALAVCPECGHTSEF
jgi:hypothetical protein